MKLVLDTNVLVAAFVSHGTCNELLEHCALHHEIVLSKPILDELQDVLARKFRYTHEEARAACRLLRTRVTLVRPLPLPRQVSRDPDDDVILGTALAGACVAIVTGDKDLTDLKAYRNIQIIPLGVFWQFERDAELSR